MKIAASLASLCIAFVPQLAAAQTPPAVVPPAPQPAARGPALDLAVEAARVAVESCTKIEQKVAVSVVDSAGVLKVLLAADGVSPRGVQSSTGKATTALSFKTPTSQLGEQAKTDKELADKLAAAGPFAGRAGGILVKSGSEIVGAIGVGGARGSEKDEACALAGLQKIQDRL